ncbi:chromosomal protein D1-like [Zeugodacus cucurbitae]|uniref:chromosomal protein D1-like n=1 Tax=Zeugodacus cucurbitae TaxID=28588 RepID=UPI0005969F2C|nr:chromosomal protein D1-like [Zeugodacus cucurbitae]
MQRSSAKNQQNNLLNFDNNTGSLIDKMAPRRGRPRKLGKLKITHPIVATGKGRGRPKVPNLSTELHGIVASSKVVKKPFQSHQLKSVGRVERRGRPRKEKPCSDSENSYCDEKPEFEERRPVGRPSTGAVNLNIVRTGRGQGRPKKLESRTNATVKVNQSNDNQPMKKRGRPSKGGIPYKPTGKPRGRPKSENKTTQKIEDTSEEYQRGNGDVDVNDKHIV